MTDLVMEIWTDGSITPEKAISQAAAILIEHMNLFILEEEERRGRNFSRTG